MVHRAKSERLSVIVLHSRLFDMEHRLLLRIFLHEEETGSSKRPPKEPNHVRLPGCRTHTQDIIRGQEGSYRFPKITHVVLFWLDLKTQATMLHLKKKYHTCKVRLLLQGSLTHFNATFRTHAKSQINALKILSEL